MQQDSLQKIEYIDHFVSLFVWYHGLQKQVSQ